MTDFIWGAITAQLNAAANTAPQPTRTFYNPRPKGVIQPGSTTDAVLRILR